LWFLVPGVLLPCVPALFRAKPWQNRYEALLPIVILLSLLFEALVLLSLRSVPAAAREFWQQTLDQVPGALKKRGPLLIIVVPSLLFGGGSIPLFLFARRHLSEWTATALTLAYLAYYPMHGATFSEFQNVPIAALFVFGVVWAADAQRWIWMSVFTAIALLMREDVPIGLSVVGMFLLASGYRPAAGLVLAAVSTSSFLVVRFYVLDEGGDWWFAH